MDQAEASIHCDPFLALVLEIAVQAALTYLSEQQSNLRIIFCGFLESDLEIY